MKELLISEKDLSKAGSNLMNAEQLQFILSKTPPRFVKERPAKGGGTWKYVEVAYVTKVLNLMFGWDWSFEVVEQIVNLEYREVIVKGRLTVTTGGKQIIKEQYGNKDIMFRKDSKVPLSVGNDLKAAASDSLKKCASLLGVAQDIYSSMENKEVIIEEAQVKDIAGMLCNCETIEDVNVIWGTLITIEEQKKYLKIFEIYRNGLQ